ncbi:TIGR04104 family putative zinc finger protein [Alkalihalobacillus sp. CinArs1]|uniref:TIGR04104 family putative zinc finger protein n=1 Tax=Alkalihalobacillus sp. CinArs1 TaxID=2995314 RepID=UPI003FA46AA5
MNGCPSCYNTVSRWYLFKRTLLKKEYPLACPHCSQNLYFTARSLKISFSFIPVLPILLIVFVLYDIPEAISGLTIMLLLGILLSAYPFIVKLTDKQENLF